MLRVRLAPLVVFLKSDFKLKQEYDYLYTPTTGSGALKKQRTASHIKQ